MTINQSRKTQSSRKQMEEPMITYHGLVQTKLKLEEATANRQCPSNENPTPRSTNPHTRSPQSMIKAQTGDALKRQGSKQVNNEVEMMLERF